MVNWILASKQDRRRTEIHPSFVVTSEVFSDNAIDVVGEPSGILSVEYSWPEVEDVIDVAVIETAMASSWAVIVIAGLMVDCGCNTQGYETQEREEESHS